MDTVTALSHKDLHFPEDHVLFIAIRSLPCSTLPDATPGTGSWQSTVSRRRASSLERWTVQKDLAIRLKETFIEIDCVGLDEAFVTWNAQYCQGLAAGELQEEEHSSVQLVAQVVGKAFATQHGLIGVGLSKILRGDVIVVPFGASMPFLLRRVEDEYYLIGTAYVDGIMNGEWMEYHKAHPDQVIAEEFRLR